MSTIEPSFSRRGIGHVFRLPIVAALLLVGVSACSSSGSSSQPTNAKASACKTKPVEVPEPTAHLAPTDAAGVVTVHGADLPLLPASGDDPAVGCATPVIDGQSFNGTPIRIGGSGVGQAPTVVIAAAHWCPHCNNELPKLEAAFKGGSAGMQYVVVSTGISKGQPNYPPGPWLTKDMGWTGGIMADDAQSTAAKALGVSGFPMYILIDTQGEVVERFSGETDPAEVLKKANNLAGVSLKGGLHAGKGS